MATQQSAGDRSEGSNHAQRLVTFGLEFQRVVTESLSIPAISEGFKDVGLNDHAGKGGEMFV